MKEQAFNRVHRIGQEKAVHTYKLFVRNSVEDRILKVNLSSTLLLPVLLTLLQIQNKKKQLAGAAMNNEGIQRVPTEDELLELFGV
jgi:SNF2 family DNA or RNA helicase